MTTFIGAAVAAIAGLLLVPVALRIAPARLTRTNVHGRRVPAVLGFPLVAASLAGLLAVALAAPDDRSGRIVGATALALLVMGGAGWWDDLQGDERDRGFRGHLRALMQGKVTGGSVKIAAGGATGVVAALVVPGGIGERVLLALIVPLAANLVNLLDRAPGRAGKVALVLLAVPAAAGAVGVQWAIAPPLVALLVVLGWDLREKAMLGDSGANAIGAIAGLGVGLTFGTPGRGIVLIALLGANLASERWSFSETIARSPALAWLDMLGRRGD